MSNYLKTVKEAMVRKLTTPGAPSAQELAQEVDITQSTLSRWVREYVKLGKAGGAMKKRRPQGWTAEEKWAAVLEYEKLGLHSVHRGTKIKELVKELGRKEKALAEAAALLVLKKSPGYLGTGGRVRKTFLPIV